MMLSENTGPDDDDIIFIVIFLSLGEAGRSPRTSHFDALGPGWNGYLLHLHDHCICPGIYLRSKTIFSLY